MNGLPEYIMSEEEMDIIRREALEFAGIGMYRYKFDGTVLYMDHGALKILEIEDQFDSPEAAIGEKIENMIIYTGQRYFLRSKIREHGHVRDLIYHYKTLAGKEKWALHDSYITRDEKTGEELIQVIIKDITEMMLTRLALRESEERFQRLVNSAPDIIIRWSVDKGLEYISPSVSDITGYTPDELLSDPMLVMKLACSADPKLERDYREACEPGFTPYKRELVFPHKNGSDILLEARVTPLKDEKDGIIAFEGILRDITEKVIAERKILGAKQLAELYLDLMLHDITNFNQICLGNLDLMLTGAGLAGKERALAVKARRQLLKSENLISKLRIIPELENDLNNIVMSIDLDKTIRNCVETALHLYPEAADNLRYESREELTVNGIDLLEQAIYNIIENGIKHAADKKPEISIEIKDADSADFIELRVADNGPGISDEIKPEVFKRQFRRGKKKGLGLGLSLSRDIIEKSGGSVRIENRDDEDVSKGSIFIIRLRRSSGAH